MVRRGSKARLAFSIGLVATGLLGLGSAAGCGGTRRPDVVLIVMDTTRADRLGVYGHDRDTTPRLDAFARESEVYERAWSTSPWTLPSHASLLTGRYVSAHGAHMKEGLAFDSLGENPAHLASSAVTLAEILRDEGYATAAFAGAGWLAPEFGLLQGYQVQDAENLRTIPAAEITARAKAWIETIPADEPLHLLVNYFDAHDPYRPLPEFDLWSEELPVSEDPAADDEAKTAADKVERTLALYDGEIRGMDHQIGELLDHLEITRGLDDTLVVITADHGEAFGEKGAVGHAMWLYEPLIRIPMIVRRPGGEPARHLDPISLVDVLAIVAEATGIELPAGVDSRPPGTRELLFAEEHASPLFRKLWKLDRDVDAAVAWPYKIIANRPGKTELYRLDHDPSETHDLADGEREKGLLEQLDRSLADLEPLPEDERAPEVRPEIRDQLRELGYVE